MTGSRADFGLVRNVIDEINRRENWDFHILKIRHNSYSVMSQSEYASLSDDNIKIEFEVENEISYSTSDIVEDFIKAVRFSHETFKLKAPELVLVLGDRHETLATVISANLSGIPIAHISGGEITEGSYDESFRHAITKMSNLHFVKEPRNKLRVMRLGECPESIFEVGNLARDSISRTTLKRKEELEQELGITLGDDNLLVVIHPETRGDKEVDIIGKTLKALEVFPRTTLLFTAPGNDVGASAIDSAIQEFVIKRENAFYFSSLGQENYLSLMAHCIGIVGNSSSGIYEAPLLGLFSVNIGDRQSGRESSDKVIHCTAEFQDIVRAITTLYSKRNLQMQLEDLPNQDFASEKVSEKIVNYLESINPFDFIVKRFYEG